MLLDRKVLHEIQVSAQKNICEGMNENWKQAYRDLAHAACVVDAFLARSSGPIASIPDAFPLRPLND